MADMNQDREWHLDKKVPLALILTLIFQSGTFIWWASGLTERVNMLERVSTASAPQADRLTRVEVRIESISEGISEIKRLIRKDPS